MRAILDMSVMLVTRATSVVRVAFVMRVKYGRPV